MAHKMVHICLAQINGKWCEKWRIKTYPKSIKRLIIALQRDQRAHKGLIKGSKGQKSQEIQGKGKKIGREIIGIYRTMQR